MSAPATSRWSLPRDVDLMEFVWPHRKPEENRGGVVAEYGVGGQPGKRGRDQLVMPEPNIGVEGAGVRAVTHAHQLAVADPTLE